MIFLCEHISKQCLQLLLFSTAFRPPSPLLPLLHLTPQRELTWAPGRDSRPTAQALCTWMTVVQLGLFEGALAVRLGSIPGAWASFSETIPYGGMPYSCCFNKNFILRRLQRCPIILLLRVCMRSNWSSDQSQFSGLSWYTCIEVGKWQTRQLHHA